MAGEYDFKPTHINGYDLAGGSSPFDSVRFNPDLWPAKSGARRAITAALAGRGDRLIRMQPASEICEIFLDLKDGLQATLSAAANSLAAVFDEEAGLVYVRANDGTSPTPVNYRVAMHGMFIDRISALQWKAVLYVPDPMWEANTETVTTGSFANMSGDSASQAVTHAGNRKSWLTFEMTQDADKEADPGVEFLVRRNGTLTWRSPQGHQKYPILVNSNGINGLADPLDSATEIRDTSISNQAVLSWSASATEIPVDTPVGGGLPAGGGFAWNEATGEQLYYASNVGGGLSNCIRGVGGTTAAPISNNVVLEASRMLKDGSDIRVKYGEVWVPRWIGGLNTADTRIWINASAEDRTKLELESDIDASQTTITFKDVSALAVPNVIMCEREPMAVIAKDVAARTASVIRGVYYGVGTTHTAAQPVYAQVEQLMLCYGRYGLGAAPEPIEHRPCIDLKQSDNHTWYYGDTAQDPLTVFYDPGNPARSAPFAPNYHVPTADNNNAPQLQLSESGAYLGWKDSAAALGKLNVGNMTLWQPCGIAASANAITVDHQKRRNIRLRLFGRDARGDQYNLMQDGMGKGYDVDEANTAGDQFTPVDILHELTLGAVRSMITGSQRGLARTLAGTGSAFKHSWKFDLEQDSEIDALLLKLGSGAGDTGTYIIEIVDPDSSTGDPGDGTIRYQLRDGPGSSDNPSFHLDNLQTSTTWEEFRNDLAGTMFLQAGTYWIVITIRANVGVGANLNFAAGLPHTPNNEAYSSQLTDPTTASIPDFRLIHGSQSDGLYRGPIQPEAALLNQATEAHFAKLILKLNAAGDPYTPRVDTSFVHNSIIQHLTPRIKNEATSEYIDIDVFAPIDAEVKVDTFNKTLTREDAGGAWVETVPNGVVFASSAEWVRAGAGAQTYSYTEAGMTNTDMTVRHRDRKAV